MSDLASELLRGRLEAQYVTAPSTRDEAFDLEKAYAIGAELQTAWVQRGSQIIGRKLGFTNRAIWNELGVNDPIWASIYDTTVTMTAGGEATHSLAGAVEPRIELEVVVKLSAVSPVAIEWAALGYEIVQCPYRDWKFTPADAVAAFGLHRALLVGRPLENATGLEALEVTLTKNGERVASGEGSSILGGPVKAVEWLVELLSRQRAAPLEPGEIVTTGTLTGALPIKPGEVWSATGAPLEGLDVAFV